MDGAHLRAHGPQRVCGGVRRLLTQGAGTPALEDLPGNSWSTRARPANPRNFAHSARVIFFQKLGILFFCLSNVDSVELSFVICRVL